MEAHGIYRENGQAALVLLDTTDARGVMKALGAGCERVIVSGEGGVLEVRHAIGGGYSCAFRRDNVTIASQLLHLDGNVNQFLERWLPRTMKAVTEAAR
jgi:hypothetical protein